MHSDKKLFYNVNKKNGFNVHKLTNPTPIELVRKTIDSVFKGKENIKNSNIFRKKLFKCQKIINDHKIHKQILFNEKKFFKNLLGLKNIGNDISVQTAVYLRGVRPQKKGHDYLSFHRENFYNDTIYAEKQINVHIPIKNYNSRSSLKYLKGSHLIPDSKISILKINSKKNPIKRFSVGHKLGLRYAPKKIVGGVNFSKVRRWRTKKNEIVAFTGRLIHGGGNNLTNKVRFSLDFGILKSKDIKKGAKINIGNVYFASFHKSKKHYEKLKLL